MKTVTKFNYPAFAALALVCFALLPRVQAAPDPTAPPASNTRDGQFSLASITTGINNSAFGTNALNKLTIGNNNAAQGNSAQFLLIDGNNNTALGVLALRLNVHGDANTAVGRDALYHNTSDFNTAVGYQAGNSIEGGSDNVVLGAGAGIGIVGASNSIAIGVPTAGPFADSDFTCFIGSIHGEPVSDPVSQQAVYVDKYNVLGFANSSRRFKHDIQPMDKGSEALLALKPVTFKYNSDEKGTTQYGLIAEEVAEVNPDLVVRGKTGEINTVRYEQVNAMLLNEFLKEHRTVQKLKSTVAQQEKDFQATVAQQQKEIKALTASLKEQASQIQKVSNQLELSKSAPRTVLNNQ